PVWYLVPDGVVQYINKYNLYRPGADPLPAGAEIVMPRPGARGRVSDDDERAEHRPVPSSS
ncbi:hypothetical protein PU560_01110, partial [Georgenia sp. 10Sc9-8]|nr:hypothetical protein [Georgenia halotolerans]